MPKIVDIFRKYAPAYLAAHGDRVPAEQQKVIEAMLACRTGTNGVAVYGCGDCPDRHVVPLGCGNRHCPNCQHDKSQQWLNRTLDKLLPGPHFMVTFTVPEQLRRFFRSNQRFAYDALFAASSDAIKGAMANPKHCGSDRPGFFGVLQTWTRQLEYHPHIHYVVPAGGLDRATGLWKPTGDRFLVPERTLSTLVREKFKAAAGEAGLLGMIDARVWRRDWVVDIQAVGSNVEGVVKYLAPYVFRVAISDSRIVAEKDGLVTFAYTPSGTSETRQVTLRAFEFIRRFLQHVLPTGFMKIRYYGFMGSACKIPREEIAAMIALADADSPILLPDLPEAPPPVDRPPMLCPCCGKPQRLLQIWKRQRLVYSAPCDHPAPEVKIQ